MTLRVQQDSEARSADWWIWSVWLEGDKDELDAIDHVVYTLHPTFSEPVRTVKNRRSGFRLESAGWGEFEIYIKITLKNGKTRDRKHWLTLTRESVSERAVPGKFASTKQSRGKPGGATEHRLVTFISSSATDSALARKVATRLETRGFRVVSADQLKPGVPWDVALDGLLRSADVAVFLLSGRSSLFVYNEIERALAYEVSHIVPVVIGTSVEIPPRLEQFTAIHVDAADDEAVARQILDAADAAGWFDAR